MASAARRPERTAPSIVPANASVCSPAKWTRPSGRRSAAWKRFTCARRVGDGRSLAPAVRVPGDGLAALVERARPRVDVVELVGDEQRARAAAHRTEQDAVPAGRVRGDQPPVQVPGGLEREIGDDSARRPTRSYWSTVFTPWPYASRSTAAVEGGRQLRLELHRRQHGDRDRDDAEVRVDAVDADAARLPLDVGRRLLEAGRRARARARAAAGRRRHGCGRPWRRRG